MKEIKPEQEENRDVLEEMKELYNHREIEA